MPKQTIRQSMKRCIVILVSCFLIIGLGYLGLRILLSKVTELNTASSIGEISDIVLSYFSIFVSIMLGIVVYWQAERINKLESTQYDVFLGAEKLHCGASIGTQLLLLSKKNSHSQITLFETKFNNCFGLLANISLQEEINTKQERDDSPQDRTDNLPLTFLFVTRNTPLITSLQVKQIDLTIQHYSESKKKDIVKKYPIDANPVFIFLSDKSEFNVCLSVNGVEKKHIETVKIRILYEVEDQLERTHSIMSEIVVEQIDGEICMISSKSNS